MRIGEKVQILRKQKDISQEQLAEMLNVSRQAISKWETGESLPDVENIVRLSGVFDVSTDYLLKAYQPDTPVAEHPPGNMVINNDFIIEDDDEDIGYTTTRNHGGMFGAYNISFHFGGVVFPVALLAFLIMGFVWGLWRAGFIVFPVAWVVDAVISYVRTGRLRASFSGVAVAVYLILGFAWRLWHPGWIVFVVAWVLSEAVRVASRERENRKGMGWRNQ